MKKLKSLVLIILVAITSVMFMAGCSKKSNNDKPADNTNDNIITDDIFSGETFNVYDYLTSLYEDTVKNGEKPHKITGEYYYLEEQEKKSKNINIQYSETKGIEQVLVTGSDNKKTYYELDVITIWNTKKTYNISNKTYSSVVTYNNENQKLKREMFIAYEVIGYVIELCDKHTTYVSNVDIEGDVPVMCITINNTNGTSYDIKLTIVDDKLTKLQYSKSVQNSMVEQCELVYNYNVAAINIDTSDFLIDTFNEYNYLKSIYNKLSKEESTEDYRVTFSQRDKLNVTIKSHVATYSEDNNMKRIQIEDLLNNTNTLYTYSPIGNNYQETIYDLLSKTYKTNSTDVYDNYNKICRENFLANGVLDYCISLYDESINLNKEVTTNSKKEGDIYSISLKISSGDERVIIWIKLKDKKVIEFTEYKMTGNTFTSVISAKYEYNIQGIEYNLNNFTHVNFDAIDYIKTIYKYYTTNAFKSVSHTAKIFDINDVTHRVIVGSTTYENKDGDVEVINHESTYGKKIKDYYLIAKSENGTIVQAYRNLFKTLGSTLSVINQDDYNKLHKELYLQDGALGMFLDEYNKYKDAQKTVSSTLKDGVYSIKAEIIHDGLITELKIEIKEQKVLSFEFTTVTEIYGLVQRNCKVTYTY